MQARSLFILVQGSALIPAPWHHLAFFIHYRSEREKHAADDSEGGILDMCCSERLPGESAQHPGAPELPGHGESPGWHGLEWSPLSCELAQEE